MPALKRRPPGDVASARALQRNTRRHCARTSLVAATSDQLTLASAGAVACSGTTAASAQWLLCFVLCLVLYVLLLMLQV